MKKTLKINIKGFVFQIDEDAYQLLQGYLTKLEKYFANKPGGEEIVSDLELRIAELLQQKLGERKEVITLDDAKSVIDVLGNPEEFDVGTTTEEENKEESGTTGKGSNRTHRLYRDPDNSILGGVSAGLGAYFRTDPILFRVLFVVLSLAYGVVAILYIIMWIVVPAAKTTAQKLEMRGEPVTIDNIERAVKNEYDNVRENFKKYSSPGSTDRFRDFLGEFARVLGIALMALAKVIVFLFGLILIIGGFAMAISAGGIFFLQKPIISNVFEEAYFNFQGFLGTFVPSSDPTLLILTFAIVIGIPILAIMYTGIKILFRFKSNDKMVGLGAFVLWFLCTLYLSSIIMIEARSYSTGAENELEAEINIAPGDTLYIEMDSQVLTSIKKDHLYFETDEFGIYFSGNEGKIHGKTILDIRRTNGNNPKLYLEKSARGIDSREANRNLELLSFNYKVEDNKLILPPVYTIEDENQWRAQYVEVDLEVPGNMIIIFDEELEGHIDHVYGNELDSWQLPGKSVKSTDDGLVRPY